MNARFDGKVMSLAVWVDMDEIAGEGDWTVGTEIAENGIASLVEINAGKRRIIKPLAV